MTHQLIYLVSAFVAASFLLSVMYARQRSLASVSPENDAAPSLRPVDLEAFRNLMDPAQEAYLREKLRPSEFRSVQRRRLAAAIDYVACVRANASVLQRLGDAARAAAEPETAQAGAQLVDTALRLQVHAARLRTRLSLAWLLPGMDFSPAEVADGYQDLCGLVAQLRRMRYADPAVRAAAVV